MDGRLCWWGLVVLVTWRLEWTRAQSGNSTRPLFRCGGHVVTDSGFIASEGFPNHYKPNSKCTWYITVPVDQVVMLAFRLIDMEADPTCRYDYLDIYNGHSQLVQKLGRFCGTFRPGAVISTSNTMMLEMTSDGSTAGRGFLVYFSGGKPHVEENQFCGGRLTKSQGSVKTPNWPISNYPAGISCSWHISVEPGNVIEVKFQKLDLEADTYCRYDYVAFFNGGERVESRRIGKYCGDRVPGTIVTSGHELLVQFVSDLSVTSAGFMAFYSGVPRGSRTPTAGGDFIHGPRSGSVETRGPVVKPAKAPKPTRKPKPSARLKPAPKTTTRPAIRLPVRPPPRTPTRRPAVRPTLKPKPAKPAAKPSVRKPTAKPSVSKPTAKPPVRKPKPKPTTKPKFKPGTKAKPTAKPAAKAKTKPTTKLSTKPARPTPKSALKPSTKTKPKVTAKPGQPKTVTKKPVVAKKPLPLNPLCTRVCKRSGTLQSNFCPNDFVITGKVMSLTPGARGSVLVEMSLIKAFKTGRLKMTKSGPTTSVKMTATCKKCPGLQKGSDYVLMGKVDALGNGLLSPSSFSLLYKPIHAKALANYARQSC